MFETVFEISQGDLENEYNHLDHVGIVSLLQKARLRFFDECGFSHEKQIKMGYFKVISSISISFLREIKTSSVKITCENIRFDNKSLKIRECIFDTERGKLLVAADIEIKFIKAGLPKAVDPPSELIKRLIQNDK
ncbi:MAG: acyl-CoA thioesterase [bacterium]|nr:acyl-CoA thioesterase [bacterium]